MQATASYRKGVVATSTEELLPLPEAAERLGVSVYTVRRWIKDGKLKAFRPGKEYRIREADLEEFLAAREVRPKVPRRSSPEPSPPKSGLEDERPFFSLTAEAIALAAERWNLAVTSADIDVLKRSGYVDIALDLSDVIGERAEAGWEALPNQEGLEIISAMEKLTEVAERGLHRLHESRERLAQEERVKQSREQIREMMQRIA